MAQFARPKYTTFLFLTAITCLVFADAAVEKPYSTRIVNGEVTQIAKHPYIVSVHRRSCVDCRYEHRCAGTIYNNNTVITAANCVRDAKLQDLLVVAGSRFRTDFFKDGGMIFPVTEFVNHPDESIDLAIITLALEISLGSSLSMRAVSLATATPPTGAVAVIAGWGRIAEDGDYSEELREASISILNAGQCQITDNEICAGYTAGGTGACQGDAGGPLIVNGHMIGVTSWDVGCASPEKPGVYTNVVKQSNWIVSHVLGVHVAFL